MINTHGSADSQQLKMMTDVLQAYCEAHGVELHSDDHHEAARRIIQLFEDGTTTPEKLTAALSTWTRSRERVG